MFRAVPSLKCIFNRFSNSRIIKFQASCICNGKNVENEVISRKNGFDYIVPVPADRYNDVITGFRNYFIYQELICNSIQLVKKSGDPHEEFENKCLEALKLGLSTFAVSPKCGTVVGGLICTTLSKELLDKYVEEKEEIKCEKLKLIIDFLFDVTMSTNLFERFCVDKVLDCHITFVNSDFRCKGIATELLNVAEYFARKIGYKMLKADATSCIVAKNLTKMGFHTICEVPYKDYKNEKGEVIFNTKKPNTSLYVMVKELD